MQLNTDKIKRRAFIAGAAALAPAAALANAVPRCTDPHRQWLAEFRRIRILWEDAEEDTDDSEALWARFEDLEDLICQTPATTSDGLRAQIEWLLEDGADYWAKGNHGTVARSVLETLSSGALAGV